MDILEIELDSTGFVYDPLQPTLQTEKLSYMLNVGLEGAILRLPVGSETELVDRDSVLSRIVAALKDGIDDQELEYSVPSIEGLLNKMNFSWGCMEGVNGLNALISDLRDFYRTANLKVDEEGVIVGLQQDDVVSAIQDVAGSAGLSLDAYGDVIEVCRVAPVQEG
jgi:hypothetical protein